MTNYLKTPQVVGRDVNKARSLKAKAKSLKRPRPEASRPRPEVSRPRPRPEIKAKVEFNSYGL